MTKIANYAIKTPVIAADKWIGTNGLDGITTKNFSAQDIADFVVAGLSPIDGGTFKTTEIEIDTLDTNVSTTVNAMTPAYEVQAYEQVWFNIEDRIYVLKSVDLTIGVGGTTLTNDDFIIVPVNTGATGNGIASIALFSTVGLVKTYRITYTNASTFDFAVSDGTQGDAGDDGLNADITRTSTTSLAIASSGSKTLAYTASANLGWLVGTRLRFAKDGSNYMEGAVTSVSSTSVTITVDNYLGSGTYATWNISIAGDKGASATANSIIVEDTAGALVITSQNTADLDYDLSFQLDGTKCFFSGTITNNTGVTKTAQTVLSFINSAYNTRTSYDFDIIGRNDSGAVRSILLHNTTLSVDEIEDGEIISVNGFYFTN